MKRQVRIAAGRHGNAPGVNGRPDSERRLSETGHEQARSVGKQLAACGFKPLVAVHSPMYRALQTLWTVMEQLTHLVWTQVDGAGHHLSLWNVLRANGLGFDYLGDVNEVDRIFQGVKKRLGAEATVDAWWASDYPLEWMTGPRDAITAVLQVAIQLAIKTAAALQVDEDEALCILAIGHSGTIEFLVPPELRNQVKILGDGVMLVLDGVYDTATGKLTITGVETIYPVVEIWP